MWHGLAHISPPGGGPSSRSAPPPASPRVISFPHETPALCFSAVMPVHPTAFCPSPALDASERPNLASSLCPSGWGRAECKSSGPSQAVGYCQPSRCRSGKWQQKQFQGVKAFIPWQTACCEDALSLGMENYGLMSHRRASLWGEGSSQTPEATVARYATSTPKL